nr:MAG TPA: tail protein [Caudoviricetes sp.]
MLEKIIYENHKGERFGGGADGIYINQNELRDYVWDYTSRAERVTAFSRGVVEKAIPLIILCESESKGAEAKNRLFSIAEIDVLESQPGRFICGDFYLSGYIIGSQKTGYLIGNQYMELSLKFATDSKYWIREKKVEYLPKPELSGGENKPSVITGEEPQREALENKAVFGEFSFDLSKKSTRKVRYPLFDLPFDFVGVRGQETIENPSFTASNFVMTIYGFADTPSVLIAGHPYTVHATVYEGERIVIDSANRTVIKIGRLGEITNLYNSRGKQYSVFQKIPSGVSPVSWSGAYGIDILLKDERSEPEWSL